MKKILFTIIAVLSFFVVGSLFLPKVALAQTCGTDPYLSPDDGKSHITYCSLVHIFTGTAPYGGCHTGEQCFIGPDLGGQDCNWAKDSDGLKFCFGGFSSPQELQASTVQIKCVSNCGGANVIPGNNTVGVNPFAPGSVVQQVSLVGAPTAPDGKGGNWSCILLPALDQSVINAVNYQMGAASLACNVAGVGGLGVLGLASGGAGLIGTLVVEGADIASMNACVNAANQYTPTIETTVVKADGSIACRRNMSIQLSATGEVTSVGGNVGGLPPGTHLFGPNVNLTATCPDGHTGLQTAIGCIPIDSQNGLVGFFLKWGIGIGGGIAFLLILVAGFQIMTSRGDPNRLKAGQELMTSAIAGLLLLVFSLVILKIIGVDILKIPGFSTGPGG